MLLLSDVVAKVESSGSPLAVRHEPEYSPDLFGMGLLMQFQGAWIDNETAKVLASMSWGCWQIMGDNLFRKGGWRKSVLTYANSSREEQLPAFRSFLKSISFEDVDWFDMASQHKEVERFALAYNGSAFYAQKLMMAARSIGGST